jgi:uncharacterized protein (TIGR02147 family)
MAARRSPPKRTQPGVSVFEFLDYRAFLRACYEAGKKTRAGLSFRTISKRAGLRSPNFFKLVMDGQRNLGIESVPKFADALGLEGAERDFFADLVAFEHARDSAEKNRIFERIAASRRFRTARRIDGMLLTYLSHWYHPAIRELAGSADFREDPKWIAGRLRPSIAPSQAAASLELLVELGLLQRDAATGRLVQGEPALTTEHEVTALGAKSFHRQMLERASEAIDGVPRELRDLCALTVCVSPKTAAVVKERIHRFREALAELCDADTARTVVYQLNVQWFPLSRSEEDATE